MQYNRGQSCDSKWQGTGYEISNQSNNMTFNILEGPLNQEVPLKFPKGPYKFDVEY